MSTILVTGASGLIGNLLIEELKPRHNVLALSRRKPKGEGLTYMRGDFANWEDLAQAHKAKKQSLR
jgi:nucleoside-diphosphate-sugar epimerase